MLKTPISIKGPIGQLEKIFDESAVFQAYQYLCQNPIQNWRYNEESQISYGLFRQSEGPDIKVSMAWPIQKSNLGTCQCTRKKPCKHLTALAIFNKSKLDLLPPFTQQVRALKNISETFALWLSQQKHDPYPNMARHRLIYVLNQDEQNQLTVSLFKAYLSQDEKYEVKAKVDSSLFFKKNMPKFVTLADQHVLYLMNDFALAQVHQFKVNQSHHEPLLLAILKTNRCFWKACYRPPISIDEAHEVPVSKYFKLTENLFYQPAINRVRHRVSVIDQSAESPLITGDGFTPKLTLMTRWQELDWSPSFGERIDWAQISFENEELEFTLSDISRGLYQPDLKTIEAMAACCYQIEKLPSIHAKFDTPISEYFDINDRYMTANFITLVPMLLALEKKGWLIEIDESYRLNSQSINELYVDVDKKSAQNTGYFDVEVGVKVNGESVNLLPYLIKAIKTGQFESVKDELMIKLDDGQFIDMPKSKVMQIVETLNELYDDKVLNAEQKISLNQHQLLRLAQLQTPQANKNSNTTDQQSMQLEWLGGNELQTKLSQLKHINSLPEYQQPQLLQAELRPYQLTGVAWLQFLNKYDFHGVLADDMGLGKTLQVLAHLSLLQQNNQLNTAVLIVTPTSLLGNWLAEIIKFTPNLKALILTGQNRKKAYQDIKNHQLIITSYGVMSRDHNLLSKIDWHTLVLDEAQAIKNHKTRVAQSIKKIPAKHRLCLSGTPMENHLGEIWSLFDFLMPGFLASQKMFQKFYQWPIEKEQNQSRLQQLQARLAPFILRRTKSEVAKELPEKNEIVKFVELTKAQAEVYESIRITMSDEIRKAVKNQKSNQILIGNALLRLRQVCCHPALLKMQSINEQADSVKLNWLEMVLPNLIEEGRSVLIFSSFTSMLKLIADKLENLKINYFKLTGKTASHKRTERIEAFQQGQVPVFLISLKAGGAGINLTAADTVIHFDPWWNPAAEQQASDRAHRIGQDKQVFVYKLITRGTVEEKIHQLQQNKQLLADNLLSTTNDIGEILSSHQWEDLMRPIEA